MYHTPSEFLEAARAVHHPSHLEVLVPEELRKAVRRNVTTAPDSLARDRTETIRKWIAWSNELQPKEDQLKSAMSPHRAKILAGKRLCLFRRILEESGHQDHQLVPDISAGFSLTGRLPRSEVFKDRYRPASQTVDMLREGASRARAATLAMCVQADDPWIDEGVEEATLKEVADGVVEGPIRLEDLRMPP